MIYPPLTYYNDCGSLLPLMNETPTTFTTDRFRPEDMHTLQKIPGLEIPATKTFNFNDLPCPPANIAEQLDPGSAYRPVVVANESNTLAEDVDSTKDHFFRFAIAVADPARPVISVRAIKKASVGPPP